MYAYDSFAIVDVDNASSVYIFYESAISAKYRELSSEGINYIKWFTVHSVIWFPIGNTLQVVNCGTLKK